MKTQTSGKYILGLLHCHLISSSTDQIFHRIIYNRDADFNLRWIRPNLSNSTEANPICNNLFDTFTIGRVNIFFKLKIFMCFLNIIHVTHNTFFLLILIYFKKCKKFIIESTQKKLDSLILVLRIGSYKIGWKEY